jgi:hypothetical protein
VDKIPSPETRTELFEGATEDSPRMGFRFSWTAIEFRLFKAAPTLLRERDTLLDLVTPRGMDVMPPICTDSPKPHRTDNVIVHFEGGHACACYARDGKWFRSGSCEPLFEIWDALYWTPIPTPLTEGGNHGA